MRRLIVAVALFCCLAAVMFWSLIWSLSSARSLIEWEGKSRLASYNPAIAQASPWCLEMDYGRVRITWANLAPDSLLPLGYYRRRGPSWFSLCSMRFGVNRIAWQGHMIDMA